MKKTIILSILTLGIFAQCKKETHKKVVEKTEKISATNNYNFIGSSILNFRFFSDSTYVFTIVEKNTDYSKIEKYNNSCYLKNDTIYFIPLRFDYNRSEKAVIKNNFIEFIDGDFPLKIEIKKNVFKTKNKLNLEKYKDYAFFSFEAKFHKNYFSNKSNTLKPSDISQKELIEIDSLMKKCFSENALKLKKINKYINQCIVVTNEKQEKEVLINSYCKDQYRKEIFKYSLIQMNDGGNCNISLKINLTKHNYSDLYIAGKA